MGTHKYSRGSVKQYLKCSLDVQKKCSIIDYSKGSIDEYSEGSGGTTKMYKLKKIRKESELHNDETVDDE